MQRVVAGGKNIVIRDVICRAGCAGGARRFGVGEFELASTIRRATAARSRLFGYIHTHTIAVPARSAAAITRLVPFGLRVCIEAGNW